LFVPRLLSRTLAVTATAALLTLAAAPAHAAESPWYVTTLRLDTVAQGLTGDGVTIAVIDGQINTEVPTLKGADLQVQEPSLCYDESGTFDKAGKRLPATTTDLDTTKPTDHGTNVASMIVGSGAGYDGQQGVVGVAPGATVLYYAVYTGLSESGGIDCLAPDSVTGILPIGEAIDDAIDAGADIISVSIDFGGGEDFEKAIARAFREGVIVVASLPNSSELQMSGGMPADANGTVGVQAAGLDGTVQSTAGVPNRDVSTDIVAPGLDIMVQGNYNTGRWTDQFAVNGTSLATPLTAGVLALVMEKYPDATGNQVIQSLIHNTSGEPNHEPVRDPDELIGYGLLSPANLLSVDPTVYDDVNPLISNDAGYHVPTYDQIFNSATTEAEPTAEASPSDPKAADTGWIGVLVGILVGGLVLVGVIVLIIVMVVRKRAAAAKQ
jgi:subtilisin family serine protease